MKCEKCGERAGTAGDLKKYVNGMDSTSCKNVKRHLKKPFLVYPVSIKMFVLVL